MSRTSHKKLRLDACLLEIEDHFRERRHEQAIMALDGLDQSNYNPGGPDKGLYMLLLARKSLINDEYQEAIDLCRQAFAILADTSFNDRIGRLQMVMYRASVAMGELKQAQMAARDALSAFRRAGDDLGIVDAFNALGRVAYIRSDYKSAAEYVNDAIPFAKDDPVKVAQLTGNLGRIYLLIGDLDKAESHLRKSFKTGPQHNLPYMIVVDRLSLGYLHLRRRQFHLAESEFMAAQKIIDQHGLRREAVINLEYMGELALSKNDYVAARQYLDEAVKASRELSQVSSLLAQSMRRLAEVELELDQQDKAMKLAQMSLDIAEQIEERAEIALAHRVIGRLFAARGDFSDADRHIRDAIEFLRQVGDKYELARTLLITGRIAVESPETFFADIFDLLKEAEKMFGRLEDHFYLAETHFTFGQLQHQKGENAAALKSLREALSGFRSIGDRLGIKKVNDYLKALSESTISRALSDENEFKVFGNAISNSEYTDLKHGPLDKLFDLLVDKTGADRALLINHIHGEPVEIVSAFQLDSKYQGTVSEKFDELLKDRIINDSPSLYLDSDGEVALAELIPNGTATSILVLPLVLGSEIIGYIYLDRVGGDNGKSFNPFTQNEIDFAVGFADLVAFKAAEYQKERLLEDNIRLKAQLMERCVFPNIVTQSRQFMEMLARVRQVTNSDMPISITGETGTGKDLLAKAIHYNSNRRDKRFISVNCAALPESLLESELFGYKKGAFTGADRDKPGLFEEADGGTFFLDEIADMPPAIQAKLLRVLENQEIIRLGDTRPRKVNVRVISATNKDLKTEMESGNFRSDLYYRLCALNFAIPALRDRREDIPLLVEHFLSGSKCRISPDTMRYLIDWDWPGNVRELENEVKKLVLLANNEGTINPSLLSSRILGDENQVSEDGPDEMDFQSKGGFSLYNYLAEYEKRFIIKALKEQGGIKKRAADALQIPESTLRLKLKQYKIDPKRLDTIN